MKPIFYNILTLLIGYVFLPSTIHAQNHGHEHHHEHGVSHYVFKENKGQWHPNSIFKADLQNGALFMEKTGLTYSFADYSFIKEAHNNPSPHTVAPKTIKAHGLKVVFENANLNPTVTAIDSSEHYENYYLGNDKSKWATNVLSYHKLNYQELYNNIDFQIYEADGGLKYDFIVKPNGKMSDIQLTYLGADKMSIQEGILRVQTSIVEVVENKPYAYQIINGDKVEVICNFKLVDNKVSFDLPNGYDETIPLIIDPVLIFSSYTGSTGDNFGFTATYDDFGNAYAGGTAHGFGYPTIGAFDATFGGGSGYGADVSISKFNSNGTALIYSTYLGGSETEAPHSMVTNAAGELFVFGTTGSSNFPTTPGAYDASFGGGSALTYSWLSYPVGCDMFVVKFNAAGNNLIGSTFVGSTGNDGANSATGLAYNYGDLFRGEIVLDNAGNCLISSTTNSLNFPVTNGTTLGGGTDAVNFKLSPNLTNLTWSTFFGGAGDDSGYGIQLDAAGNIFTTGGTRSSGIPSASNSASGGTDGYLTKYSPTGNLLTSRYTGTSGYDQCFLIQLDINDDVYVVGQTDGAMPISAGKYNNANSGQFIQKFDNNLAAMTYGTVIGRGSGNVDFSPSAFLVNDCGLIYLSGWGGASNAGYVPSSTTNGLPITPDAQQSTTDGSDFYLMVLSKDATSLLYATYFGGGLSEEHVDGGTSRFDKDGNVYQAVCAGCGGNSDFPTTPTAVSQTNGSTNCNLGLFKFNVDVISAIASIPSVTYCWPNPVNFTNTSSGGNTFLWDFGDGTTSSLESPSHSYPNSGTYTVKLVVSDSTGCALPDSSTITIQLFNPVNAQVTPDTGICPNGSVQLNASGGATYLWSPATGLSSATVNNPIASPTVNTTYQVIVTDLCGSDTAEVEVIIYPTNSSISIDTLICSGGTANLTATGGGTYSWTPAASINNPSASSVNATPTTSTNYTVSITTVDGCAATESVFVEVDVFLPTPTLTNDTGMCNGEIMPLEAGGGRAYFWYPSINLSANTGTNVTVSPPQTTIYYVDVSNACGTVTDSVEVFIQKPTAITSPDATICFNDTFLLWANGGNSYRWLSPGNLLTPLNDSTLASPAPPQTYGVEVTDLLGCRDTAYTTISHYPLPFVDAGEDQIINFGDEVVLSPTHSDGGFFWDSISSLSCMVCENPIAQPTTTTIYTANLLDKFGCLVSDQVQIGVDGVLYIPNSFTPNGDGLNDVFQPAGKDITEFEMIIFNRWGQKIFESNDMNLPWNGEFKGNPAQIDTYIWKIKFSDINTSNQTLVGHVNLIR